MALEFICSEIIMYEKMISIPEGANCYIRKSKTISPRKGRNPRINFFNANPVPTCRMKPIPKRAAYISFNIEINSYNIEYGKPIFYDREGNNLKMKNE